MDKFEKLAKKFNKAGNIKKIDKNDVIEILYPAIQEQFLLAGIKK